MASLATSLSNDKDMDEEPATVRPLCIATGAIWSMMVYEFPVDHELRSIDGLVVLGADEWCTNVDEDDDELKMAHQLTCDRSHIAHEHMTTVARRLCHHIVTHCMGYERSNEHRRGLPMTDVRVLSSLVARHPYIVWHRAPGGRFLLCLPDEV